ncbi:UDP-glucose dehydrogenase family protein [Alkalihalobacillus deserti]|uniref:UDP-glucose dehydrogenase family protein n=1 Tax=Alkalihalobacillus deserti TaxID=2879466 RepID=UPI001D157089|nr:UDP-glucose/GDP-mannose dehydrogenase family protein [Alkalihalobacillus deserti]
MKIAVIGTGYVGLVTGVVLSHIGHDVTCIDLDVKKVERMKSGESPIYEPGLEELMKENLKAGRLNFTEKHAEGFADAEVIFIAVGTPQKEDGTADLRFIEQASKDIANHIQKDTVVVTKSTVPVGTNDFVKQTLLANLAYQVQVTVASNPEFLREGSAVDDTFKGDRIVVGADDDETAAKVESVFAPLGIPVFRTDIKSAEMIKYASNAFLATKISFINEIANICEKLGANVEDVATGMGMDDRIGSKFLQAGIGYGGSCFPKDTNALVQIAGNIEHDFELLKSVIKVNNTQREKLVIKAVEHLGTLKNKRVALLGLAFKPNTDDMREAASIVIAEKLVEEGADIYAFDPIATENAKQWLPKEVNYVNSAIEAIEQAEVAFIVTEWNEVKSLTPEIFKKHMKQAVIFDGRNCYNIEEMKRVEVEYHSIGRPSK